MACKEYEDIEPILLRIGRRRPDGEIGGRRGDRSRDHREEHEPCDAGEHMRTSWEGRSYRDDAVAGAPDSCASFVSLKASVVEAGDQFLGFFTAHIASSTGTLCSTFSRRTVSDCTGLVFDSTNGTFTPSTVR